MTNKLPRNADAPQSWKTPDCHSMARAPSDAADILRALTWFLPGTASPPVHLLPHGHQHVHMSLSAWRRVNRRVPNPGRLGRWSAAWGEAWLRKEPLGSRAHSAPSRDSTHLLGVTSSMGCFISASFNSLFFLLISSSGQSLMGTASITFHGQ